MAESYDIQLTDPLSAAFKIKAFTSNGPKFPTSSDLAPTAVSAETSLLVYGKGHPEYGERINEDILHLLENFSGSNEPQYPVSGQLWFRRYTIIRNTAGDFYLWDDITSTWNQIIPSLTFTPVTDPLVNDGDYWFDGVVLFLAIKTPSHPLSEVWLPRIFEDRNIVGVPSSAVLPRKDLVVYTGIEWRNVNSMPVSETEPLSPQVGDLWYDSVVPQLKIYDGAAFVSVASRYLELTGGILSGAIDMGTNQINNLGTPVAGTDAASKAYVDGFIGGVPSALNDLTDVTIAAPAANQYLKYNGAGQWNNTNLALTDLGISASATELNYSTGVTSNIQTQLDGKLNLTGGTITGNLNINGTLDMQSKPINNLIMDGSGTGAATKTYVDSVTGTPVLALNDLTDVILTGTTTNQLLQFDGINWVNSDYLHTHTTLEITHTSALSAVRDYNSATYPTPILSSLLENTIADTTSRLNKLDSIARREVFVASVAQTDFIFTDGKYIIGSNRVQVFKDGTKQLANERARQRIKFNSFKNLSLTAPLGLAATKVFDLDITIDGVLTTLEFNLDSTSTIQSVLNTITFGLQLAGNGTAMWDNVTKSIYVYSSTVGVGSSVDIVEGSGLGAAVDGGLLTGLSVVPATTELPVLTYSDFVPNNTILPPFPSNVTQISTTLEYDEVLSSETNGYQEVDIGGGVVGTDPTGLSNDATVYTASIVVDGGPSQSISIIGSAAQIYDDLITEINTDLVGAFAGLDFGTGNILITSDSIGTASSIAITDVDLFSTLTTFVAINAAVAGTLIVSLGTVGQETRAIQFTTPLVGGEVIELISEATSILIS